MRGSILVLGTLFAGGAVAAQTVVDFDNLGPSCPPNGQVSASCLIHDEYLALGVRFDSAGGGVGVNSSGNPVSPPNVGSATTLTGGVAYVSWVDPVMASFWNGTAPAVVDYVSITLSNTSSPSTLEAFDLSGASLGTATGGLSATITVTFPGLIHSVTIHQGPMAFDDFTFDGLSGGLAPICPGDGTQVTPCPCSNTGLPGRGCDNSAATGGAQLAGSGTTSPDTVVLTCSGELPSVVSVFLQGQALIAPVAFGDGLRCVGGILKRLYIKSASGGVVSAPGAGDPSITVRSAALGDPIAPGTYRYYQTYYRDPDLAFCAAPMGNSWNVSSGLQILW